MKKIVRISQKDLNKLLMREIEGGRDKNQFQSKDIFNQQENSEFKNIKLKDNEIEFLLDVLNRIEHDDETEEQCISNIKKALNNSQI